MKIVWKIRLKIKEFNKGLSLNNMMLQLLIPLNQILKFKLIVVLKLLIIIH